MKVQVFAVADGGTVSTTGRPQDIATIVDEMLAAFPDAMPPPNVWDLV